MFKKGQPAIGPRALIDITGKVFGRWTVLKRTSGSTTRKDGAAKWICRCECGKERPVSSITLRKGLSKSCGCLSIDNAKARVGNKHLNWCGGKIECNLRRMYGIGLEDYEALYLKQAGLCAVCKKPETSVHQGTGRVRALAVDHCHSVNKVRGLLCFTCNIGLGSFKDNPQTLLNAVEYLEMFLKEQEVSNF